MMAVGRDRVQEGMSPQLLSKGGHNIFCLPEYFVMKNNEVVQR